MSQTADQDHRGGGSGRPEPLGAVSSWLLVVVSCSLLVLYLVLHAREIRLILAWLGSP
jgi:hypothetical protein